MSDHDFIILDEEEKKDAGGNAGADELSAFYYRNLVAELFGNFEHMGREEYCAAALTQLTHHAFQQVGSLRVKTHKGLVHDYKLRVVQPGGNYGKLLLHSVRI